MLYEVISFMNTYELTVILAPGLSAEKVSGSIAAIEKAVKSVKGKVVESVDWGEKQLAYRIGKYDKGVYRHFVLQLTAAGVTELEGKVKHIQSVIRLLLVRA